MMNTSDYDVVIAGAGTAGSTLAYLLAEKGFRIALVDRKDRDKIGDKVCGDAIAAHHFTATNIQKPSRDVVRIWVRGIKVYPKDMSYYLLIETVDGGYVVDRHKYGQEILNRALEKGVELYDNINVNNLIIEDDYAKGIIGVDRNTKEIIKIYGKIVVDATGYSAILINKTPASWGIEKSIDGRDIIIAYREIVEVKKPIWDLENLHLHFISMYSPTGYIWLFPWSKDGLMLNIGNGVIARHGIIKPQILLDRYSSEVFPGLLKDRKVIKRGAWNIPNRRPRDVFVGNGFIAVGDSAIMIDPATAEGIGYGLYGAYIASKYLVEALESKDYSQDMLWRYQYAYMVSPYGVRQARLDVFKYFLQAYSDEDYQFVIKHKILTSKDMVRARNEDDFLNTFDKATRALKATLYGRYKLIKDLKYTIDQMKVVKNLYQNYPIKRNNVKKWSLRVRHIFSEISKRFPPYIPNSVRYSNFSRRIKTK